MRMKVRFLELGLTQREVANRLGKTDTWMSLVVMGRKIPEPQDRQLIAQQLHVDEAYLWPRPVTEAADNPPPKQGRIMPWWKGVLAEQVEEEQQPCPVAK